PSGWHWVPPQKPLTHPRKLQHSLASVQGAPWVVQATPPQNPSRQSSAQQSVVIAQATPVALQTEEGLQMESDAQTSSPQHDRALSPPGFTSRLQLPAPAPPTSVSSPRAPQAGKKEAVSTASKKRRRSLEATRDCIAR